MNVVVLEDGLPDRAGGRQPGRSLTRSWTTPARTAPPTVAGARPPADLEVAIPAYNEAARLPQTLQRTVQFLRDQPWSSRVVVVDNGSHDETADIARAIAESTDRSVPIDVMGCARPGKGAVVRRALLTSRSRYVGFFDADLATPVETLATAMAHLTRGAPAVIGSRRIPGALMIHAQPPARRLGGAAFRLLTRSMVKGVHDTQCGFKFFDREAVTHALVACRSTGFAFDVELLRQLQRSGLQIVEIPVAWSDAASSTFHPWRDGLPSFGAVLQMRRSTPGWLA
jgi:glycosyltransferase involved in cell wall biosynthesis